MAVIFTRQHQPAVARVFAPRWLVIELHVMWISYDHHTSQWTFSSHPRNRERGNAKQKKVEAMINDGIPFVILQQPSLKIPKRGSTT